MRMATRSLILLCLLGSGAAVRGQPPRGVSEQPASERHAAAAPADRPSAAQASAQPEVPGPRLPDPVAWPHRIFNIPFETEQTGPQPVEVLLLASADRGATWSIYARQYGAKGQFQFRAARDGEYWFVSHTLQPGMRPPTQRPALPELRIIVDSMQPQLQGEASIDAQGEIDVRWEATDEHLAADSLQLEYQPALGKPWQSIAVPPSSVVATSTSLQGHKRWKPADGSRLIVVRISVQDQAGNRSELIRRLIAPFRFAAPSDSPQVPEPRAASTMPSDPFARYGLGGEASGGSPSNPSAPSAAEGDLGAATAATAAPDPAPAPTTSAGSGRPVAAPPARDAASRPPEEIPGGVAWPSAIAESDQPDPRVDTAAGPQPEQDSAPGVEPSTAGNRLSGTRPGSVGVREASSGSASERRTAGREDREPARNSYGLPVGERPRMSSAKRFNLDYSVNAVGPPGVEKVELWVTRDGGQSWDLWDVDQDRETPLLVAVEEEGIYGFRVVIVGKNGLASQTPGPGDVADLWVGIDTTPPDVELTHAAYGTEARAGQLDIRWRAEDGYLGERPVMLKISEQESGPWTTIASGLPNTGQHYWRVDSRVPEQFYLRLEVRDEAGNLGTDQLDRPLQSSGLIPRGYVRGFAPAE